jgi:GNAT superfamily N-acetyltransferase
MALAIWWRGDSLPNISGYSDLAVHTACDDTTLAVANRISIAEVDLRRNAGHRPYVALVSGIPAAYGWVATRKAEIGELDLCFTIPAEDRYLWDFATLTEWQGRGIYPRLLQAIIVTEGAARYWILYAPENLPSGAGIEKAGFVNVGQLSFQRDGTVGLAPLGMPERAQAGAALLNVPLLEDQLSPCWRCVDKVVCACQLDPESCTCTTPVRRSQAPPSIIYLEIN